MTAEDRPERALALLPGSGVRSEHMSTIIGADVLVAGAGPSGPPAAGRVISTTAVAR